MAGEVIATLYDFLKENETGLYRNQDGIIAYVHINFCSLDDFVKIAGYGCFDEGGMDAKLFSNTIYVEINDLIEGYGHDLSSYKNCFEEHDWKVYEKAIKEAEGVANA